MITTTDDRPIDFASVEARIAAYAATPPRPPGWRARQALRRRRAMRPTSPAAPTFAQRFAVALEALATANREARALGVTPRWTVLDVSAMPRHERRAWLAARTKEAKAARATTYVFTGGDLTHTSGPA